MAPPKPGIIPLRPLQFGEILDGAFQTIRRNAAAMVGSALIFQAVSQVLLGFVSVAMLQTAESLDSVQSRAELNVIMGPLLGLMAGTLGIAVLTGFLGSVLQGVLVVPVSRSVLNRRTGFKQMWKLAAGRMWRLLGAASLLTFGGLLAIGAVVGIAVVLLMSMGPIAFAIVAPLWLGALAAYLWIALKLMFAPAAIVVERLGIYDGLLRSWQLTKNSWWRIFGITLVVNLMVGIIANVVQIPVSLAAGGIGSFVSPHADLASNSSALLLTTVISTVVGVLVGSVTFSFQTSVSALIYMDLRMRRDGLDVELMRLMETGGDADGVPGAPSGTAGVGPWPLHGPPWPSDGGQQPGPQQRGPWPQA
ncbi:glycerophosphoryl diester phosphodiesterase membrane domain-containing protein [Paenarthrobacter sp. NPDC089675]|uniref:glycerophosphoryl diester phosphodiesterase membrane domain-containing protein n=1 Tax=Paenarthrobacter sp. NPDC089675 TaxID=3364376 RepID=UPI0037F91227